MKGSIRQKACLYLICGFVPVALALQNVSAKEIEAKGFTSPLINQSPLTDQEIQEEMKKYLGIRYERAGASLEGFDCSGFVKVVYREIFGVDLPHQSSQQSSFPELEEISLNSLQTGDLVFFSSNRKKEAIDHVGIYLNDRKFIHAARSRGIIISNLGNNYWRARFVVAKRLSGRIPVESEKSALTLAMPIGLLSAHTIQPALRSRLTIFREDIFSLEEGKIPTPGSPDSFEKTRAYTSFLSFFDYGPAAYDAALPKLGFGLAFYRPSSHDGWSLSTGLSMPLRRNPTAVFQEEADFHALNLSLTFFQQLSGRVHLSVTGDKFLKFAPGLRPHASRLDAQDQHFGLLLHFFY